MTNSREAVVRPVVGNAPSGLMHKRVLDKHRSDLLALQRHRNSKSSFKPMLDVPSGLCFGAIPAVLLQSLVWNSLDQLAAQRIPRSSIARTINNVVELGLVEVTHQGGYAGGARQNPSRYRLTFMNSSVRSVVIEYLPATNDWIEVEVALLDGRRQRQKRHKDPSLKRRLNDVKKETNLVIISETIGEAPSSSETSLNLQKSRC
jgi:hypothetical protein